MYENVGINFNTTVLTPTASYLTMKMQIYCLYGWVDFCQICALLPFSVMNRVCYSERWKETPNDNQCFETLPVAHILQVFAVSLYLSATSTVIRLSKTEAIAADDLEDYLAETPLHLQMFGKRQRSTRIRRLGATTNIPGLSGTEFSSLNESPVMPSVHQN